MKARRVIAVAAAAGLVAALVWVLLRPRRPVLYWGGTILTMDATNRVVEALVVEGDRIAAVGSKADLWHWAEEGARVVDLQRGALLPGFIDAHGHFPGAGVFTVVEDLNSPPIGTVRSIADMIARLQRKAAQISAGKWVVGMGYDDTLVAEKRHPTRADLDRVSPRHLVAILHISGHLAVVNSRALERLGIDRDTPDPEGGRIRKDLETGEPDGVLEENAAEGVSTVVLQPSLLDALKILRRASTLYLAAGTTTAQSGYTTSRNLGVLANASRLGLTPLRLVLWPTDQATDALLDGSTRFIPPDERWVRRGAVKLVADGSIQGYTAYLTHPYHVPPATDAAYRGYPRIPRDQLIDKVVRYHARGLQVAVHGNGDAAIDDILDAFEAAQRAQPRPQARHIVVHAQMAREDQLERMRRLGAIPSFFVLHTYYWGDRHRDISSAPSGPHASAPRAVHSTTACASPCTPTRRWCPWSRCVSCGRRSIAAPPAAP